MATDVIIFREMTVQPMSIPGSDKHIMLTPFDLMFLLIGPIQKGLLFHKPAPSPTAAIVDHLITTLSHTLDFFSPLAGRLFETKHEDGTTSFSIHCNCYGVQFTHATAHNTFVSDILDVNTPPVVRSFFPLNGALNHEGTSKPLLSVQVTELADGLFIGNTMNHCVGDGSSFWHFFNCWSEISRGAASPTRLPVFSRGAFGEPNRAFRVLFPSDDGIPRLDLEYPMQLKDRVFHFRRDSIAALKEKARAGNDDIHISSLQSLVCLLWRAVLRGRGVRGDSYTTYKLAIGTRNRTRPQLPEDYFGSATLVGKVTAKVEEVVGGGLGNGARLLNGLVAGQTWEEIMRFLDKWDEAPKLATMENIGSNSLLTGSSPRFDVYGNDFGWGRPAAVRSGGANKIDGKLSVYAGVDPGSIDVEASLLVETLEAMDNDAEFMEAVSF